MSTEKEAVMDKVKEQFRLRNMGAFKRFVGQPTKMPLGGTTYLWLWEFEADDWGDGAFALVVTNRGYALDAILLGYRALFEAAFRAVARKLGLAL